jgi:hypothetical protein
MQKRKLTRHRDNDLYFNDDDDEVRYDEIAPRPIARITDRSLENESFKLPDQKQKDFSEKIISRALLESRRNRQPNQVRRIHDDKQFLNAPPHITFFFFKPDKELRPTRSRGPLFSLLESEISKSNGSIDSTAIFNLDSYAQQVY